MFSKRTASLLLITALMLAASALPAQAALRHVDGMVVSKNAETHSFRIKTQSGSQVRIKVTSTTKFQRIAGGFGGLHKGLAVEVEAKSTSSGLVATQVETRSGGGGGGGGGADDGPNHT